MKRRISFLLIFAILFTCAFSMFGVASARASDYISSYSASSMANSDKTVSVYFKITATGIMSTVGALSIQIQKYDSGSWTTIQILNTVNRTGLQKTSAIVHTNTITSDGLSSGTYRAYVNFYAANSNGSDLKGYTTTSVYVS